MSFIKELDSSSEYLNHEIIKQFHPSLRSRLSSFLLSVISHLSMKHTFISKALSFKSKKEIQTVKFGPIPICFLLLIPFIFNTIVFILCNHCISLICHLSGLYLLTSINNIRKGKKKVKLNLMLCQLGFESFIYYRNHRTELLPSNYTHKLSTIMPQCIGAKVDAN